MPRVTNEKLQQEEFMWIDLNCFFIVREWSSSTSMRILIRLKRYLFLQIHRIPRLVAKRRKKLLLKFK